jgi:TPP-dependent pyruvate/acetoin dehydrogenase alpha subunit
MKFRDDMVPQLSEGRAKEILDSVGEDSALQFLERMYLIRAFEEKAEELYTLGKTHGTMHLSIGQEASAVGASAAVSSGYDYLLNHHRGHGHCIAWGGDVNLMMAEFMGKETGYCRGRGGSMHIADVERNNLGANGIVAGGIPISVGVGLSIKMRKTDQVCLVIFGDGAANTGPFHEAFNMAAIWNLPVIFMCENNQYAMSMSAKRAFSIERLSQRAKGFNVPGASVDGNDFLAVYDAIGAAAGRARSGRGPTLVEVVTYRWRGHSKSDRQLYRTRDEVKEWQAREPIARFANLLKGSGWLDDELQQGLRARVYQRIEEAVKLADASPEPDVATIMEGVYAD